MEQLEFVALIGEGKIEEFRAELKRSPSWARREILEEYCPPKLAKGRGGNRPLALACFFGQTKMIDLLLAAGADPEHRNAEHRSAYHIALEHNFDAVRHLVKIGVPRDHIVAACLHDHARLRELLEGNRALANDESTRLSVLGWATYYGAIESAQILFEFGAKAERGELRAAAGIANVEMGKLLLQHGANINDRAADTEWTALHVAAAHLYTRDAAPFIAMLIERGADVSLGAGKRQLTALGIARAGLRMQNDQNVSHEDPNWKNFSGAISLLDAQS